MCQDEGCKHGKYFHLSCLGYKRMPNNGKTTWKCGECKKLAKIAPTHGKTASLSPTCTSLQSTVNSNASAASTQDISDFSSDSDDDIEVIKVTSGQVNKQGELASLQDYHYRLIIDPTGWLDCDIIQRAHVLLHEVNPHIQGLQRPTLGPVKNFDVVTGEFIQILHTGKDHWVCISSIGCLGGLVHLYDSLFHEVIRQKVEDQAKDLLADSFVNLINVPVQQQNNGSDCGVFAIAIATSLAYGSNPKHITYDIAKMRPHLVNCLEAGKLSQFPTL